jgi:hypothetical protein
VPKGVYERKDDLEEAFRKLVNEIPRHVNSWRDTPCIEWKHSVGRRDSYGHLWFMNKLVIASRAAFHMFHGKFPENFACHHCDNRKCVNPHHLFDGTHIDNMKDGVAKGRFPRGADSATARHAKVDIGRVFDLNKAGCSNTEIAAWLGASQPYISRILRGQRRSHATTLT